MIWRECEMSEIKLELCPFCGGMAYLGVDYENSIISTMFHDYIYFIKMSIMWCSYLWSTRQKRDFR